MMSPLCIGDRACYDDSNFNSSSQVKVCMYVLTKINEVILISQAQMKENAFYDIIEYS